MVLDALGLNREEFLAFVASKKPTYPETETWIIQRSGGNLDKEAIAKLNASISSYLHQQDLRDAIIESTGIDTKSPIQDAVTLNNLDDWQELWKSEIQSC